MHVFFVNDVFSIFFLFSMDVSVFMVHAINSYVFIFNL